MKFGYVCENREDYLALLRIANALVRDVEMDEEEISARLDEIDQLTQQWEDNHA